MDFRTLLSQWLVLTLFAMVSACQQNEPVCHSESIKLFDSRLRTRAYLKLSVHHVAIIVVMLSLSLPNTLSGLLIGFQAVHIKIHLRGWALTHTVVFMSQRSPVQGCFVLLSLRLTESVPT